MAERKGPLAGTVALVAGATRGAGRGIATALGAAGATVWCTGRSSRRTRRPARRGSGSPFALDRRPETIEETAALVEAAGGRGRARRVDHTDRRQVASLMAAIGREHGRLDLLVNDVWGGDELTEWGVPPEALDLGKGLRMLERGLVTHLVTARLALPLLLRSRRGLVVEITDGDAGYYRANLFYDMVKMGVIRLAFGLAEELRPRGVAAVALTPGFLRSEAMLEHFGVDAAGWRAGIARDPHFAASESPAYVGRAVAALAADPRIMARSGRLFSSWELAREYGFTDLDGRRPDWDRHRRSRGLDPAGRALFREQAASALRFGAMVRGCPASAAPGRAPSRRGARGPGSGARP